MYSFKEALSPSKTLFSILGDIVEESPAIWTTWSLDPTFPTKIGDVTVSLTSFRALLLILSFLLASSRHLVDNLWVFKMN